MSPTVLLPRMDGWLSEQSITIEGADASEQTNEPGAAADQGSLVVDPAVGCDCYCCCCYCRYCRSRHG